MVSDPCAAWDAHCAATVSFLRHLRSEPYRDLLLVLEMAEAVPEVRFDVISHTTGLETILRARTGSGDAGNHEDAPGPAPDHGHP